LQDPPSSRSPTSLGTPTSRRARNRMCSTASARSASNQPPGAGAHPGCSATTRTPGRPRASPWPRQAASLHARRLLTRLARRAARRAWRRRRRRHQRRRPRLPLAGIKAEEGPSLGRTV